MAFAGAADELLLAQNQHTRRDQTHGGAAISTASDSKATVEISKDGSKRQQKSDSADQHYRPCGSRLTRHSGISEDEEGGGNNDGSNGEGPGQVVVFRRDTQAGGLTPTGATADVPNCVSVCAIELP